MTKKTLKNNPVGEISDAKLEKGKPRTVTEQPAGRIM
jgi:hypothetical protein